MLRWNSTGFRHKAISKRKTSGLVEIAAVSLHTAIVQSPCTSTKVDCASWPGFTANELKLATESKPSRSGRVAR